MRWHWIVPIQQNKVRADRLIFEALQQQEGQWTSPEDEPSPPELTRSQIQRLIREGQILANGAPLTPSSHLQEHQKIEIQLSPPKELENVEPENLPIDILFEDRYLLVLNKPSDLTVHPSPTQPHHTLVHRLLYHVQDLSGIGGVLRPGIVHRIDKDTSGAIVITKDDETHQKMSEIFSKHDIERKYLALCFGAPESTDTYEIKSTIGRNPKDRRKMSFNVPGGKQAVSRVRKIKSYSQKDSTRPFASLMEAELETGRTHQVRVHLTEMGHSILGDPQYGKPSQRQDKWLKLPPEIREHVTHQLVGQALHAAVIGFVHPRTGKPIRVEAPLPFEFQSLLEKLSSYDSK